MGVFDKRRSTLKKIGSVTCPNCSHNGAWIKKKRYFCCKCGSEIREDVKKQSFFDWLGIGKGKNKLFKR